MSLFKNSDDLVSYTKYMELYKPKGSPVVKTWIEKGGTVVIEEMADGTKVWKYTIDGKTVSYVPMEINGVIENVVQFSDEHLYKNLDFEGAFKVPEGFTGNRAVDKSNAMNYLRDEFDIMEIPEGYVLHHDIDNGVFQLVREDIHSTFSHYGGHYYNN